MAVPAFYIVMLPQFINRLAKCYSTECLCKDCDGVKFGLDWKYPPKIL